MPTCHWHRPCLGNSSTPHDGDTYFEDDEGQELDGIEEVRLQAQSGLAGIARDVVPGDRPERAVAVQVRDKAGKVVLRATLVLMVKILP